MKQRVYFIAGLGSSLYMILPIAAGEKLAPPPSCTRVLRACKLGVRNVMDTVGLGTLPLWG